MPYNPIGADENGNLPPAVRTKLEQTYAPVERALPTGGTAGQVLARSADGTTWIDPPSGGGGSGYDGGII